MKSLNSIFEFLKISNFQVLEDGSINVYQSIKVEDISLEQLRILSFIKLNSVYGDFKILKQDLTNKTDFFPKSVYGDVIISQCTLDTIVNFPKEVFGSIDLSYNNLKSIEHLPKEVFGNLSLKNNLLENLSFLPKKINGYLNIENNKIYDLNCDCQVLQKVYAKNNFFSKINLDFKYDYTILEENKLDTISYLQLCLNLLINNEIDYQDLTMIQAHSKEEAVTLLNQKIEIINSINS